MAKMTQKRRLKDYESRTILQQKPVSFVGY